MQTDDGLHSATFTRGDKPVRSDCRRLIVGPFTSFWLTPDNQPYEGREPPFTEALCQDCRAARILMS